MLTRSSIFSICLVISLFFSIPSLTIKKISRPARAADNPAEVKFHSPSPKDGKGEAAVLPNDDVVVNSYGTWKIVYTVGKEGIDPGGGIAVHISPYWGWTPPQNRERNYPGYTTVATSNEKATLDVLIGSPHYVVVRTREGPLAFGESITVTYGDTGGGSHPLAKAKCDRYAEDDEKFFIKVDGDGDGHFYPLAQQPRINILPGPAAILAVTAPSLVARNTPFTITIAALDHDDNRAKSYRGEVALSSSPEVSTIPAYPFRESDRGAKKIKCIIKEAGLYRITVEDRKNGFKAESNPILCTAEPLKENLYWGDIHGHSGLCDGTGTPDNYYQYAHEVAGLDIAALTTHDAHGFIPLDEDEATWSLIKSRTDYYYRPSEFVTFLGYEWTSWTYGHQHVLFLNSEEGVVCSSRDSQSSTPDGLWKCLQGREAMTIPHHVGGGPIPYDWNFYNAAFQPLTEISSVHGNCEFIGASKGIYRPRRGHFVRDALARGYRPGIIASGDSHNGHPGRRDKGALTGGLMAVYAKALDRESIWKAFKNKRVYATSGARIILNMSINGHPMGETISWHDGDDLRVISGEVIGTDAIREIVIIKNDFDLHTIRGTGIKSTFSYRDKREVRGRDYYYLRVTQEDGEMAWSSPIWFENK